MEQKKQLGDKLIREFSTEIKKKVDEIAALKKQLYDRFVNNKINKFGGNNLISKMNEEQQNLLLSTLKQPTELKLLFRASEHGFSVNAFHAKCDGIENTVTIVRTEHGNTIAAFTKYPWKSVNNNGNGEWVHDAGRHCWLLSIDHKVKLVPQTNEELIYCRSDYGPTFGGADLCLFDKCHENSYSFYRVKTYNSEGEPKYPNNQTTYRLFSGATDG